MKNSQVKFLSTTFITALVIAIPLSVSLMARGTKKAAAEGSAEEGQKIFQKNCAMCHNADKTTDKIGPGLKGLFKNKLLPKSQKPATEANVREQIEKGSPSGKPMPMPGFADKLSPSDLQNLIDYLKTL